MTTIIAEIGVNHDGDVGKALELVDAAVSAGADIVKTQLSVPELETSVFHAKEHADMIERVMLTRREIGLVAERCAKLDVEFMCTPAEEDSLKWLVDSGLVSRLKIASDAVTDLRFLVKAAKAEIPIILSTGMSSYDEVADAFMALRRHLMKEDITLLHCTSCYPCSPHAVNLRALTQLADFEVAVGWSDHTLSVTLPAVAVGMGATVIEKHITLRRDDPGPDHAASLEPQQFGVMVANIREAEQAFGDGVKQIQACEVEVAKVVRKSICAAHDIKKGQRLGWDDLRVMRPGTGMSPAGLRALWGTSAQRDYSEGEMI